MATAVVQSMFGVGVLLFGTPVLLILGYPFASVLAILLPVSLAINCLQVGQYLDRVEIRLVRRLLVYCIPAIALTLWLTLEVHVPVHPLVGLFLIFVAAGETSSTIRRMIKSSMRRERAFIVGIGIVHGLTNLGGSLLTAFVFGADLDKVSTRTTTAAGYGLFAIAQGAILWASGVTTDFSSGDTVLHVAVGTGVYGLIEWRLYRKTAPGTYRRLLAGLLLASGLVILWQFFTQ